MPVSGAMPLYFDRHRETRIVIRARAFIDPIVRRDAEFRMRPFLQFGLGIAAGTIGAASPAPTNAAG